MKKICIETATEQGLIAIVEENKVLFQSNIPKGFQNSRHILPELQKALLESGIKWPEISCIVCGVGPGSYTGIRIGGAVAKAISFAKKIPLIGIPTLTCFSPDEEGFFGVVLDAKISGFYALFGEKTANRITYLEKPYIMSFKEISEQKVEMITPDLKIAQKLPDCRLIEKGPDPLLMAFWGGLEFQKGNMSLDGELSLLYLRKTQAEIQKFGYTEDDSKINLTFSA